MKKIVNCFKFIGILLSVLSLAACIKTFEPEPEPPVLPKPPRIPYIPPVRYPDDSVNEVGIVSVNYVENGDADGTAAEWSPKLLLGREVGVISEIVDGGINGSKCYRQSQAGTGNWQETFLDLTPIYGQGKSYLISFKYKADPEASSTQYVEGQNYKSKDESLNIAYSVYSGDVKMICDKYEVEYYDFDYDGEKGVWGTYVIGPWGGPFSTDEFFQEALAEYFNPDIKLVSPSVLTDDWKECNVVIACEDIKEKVNNTGMYCFGLSIYMGATAQGGYSFLLDDIAVYDLNCELEIMGRTWKDPDASEEDEESVE